ncbi:hypothetical protein [Prevotella sp. AGR2160]|uniref:hypothetical protein n=1 Tax=Prevotella sp. AGR2160 TaxID=1280674 RepID=UPI0004239FF9|nr:hypothetical protein [Prevotella sp. AGR2160]
MKKFNFIYTIAALLFVGLSLTACSDDDDDYTPGAQAGENNVTFSTYSNKVLAKTATSFEIELNRHATGAALSVPVEKLSVPEGWTVSDSAKFAAGDSLTNITVKLADDVVYNTAYDMVLRVPEAYTNPYKRSNNEVSVFKATVTREDYELFATGTFVDKALGDDSFFNTSWPVKMDYSPSLKIYRVKDVFVDGYNLYFKWNGKSDADQSFTMVNSDGSAADKVAVGFTVGSYGMVYVTWACGTNDQSKASDDTLFGGYSASDNAFYLPFEFTVKAGSFGTGTEYIKDVTFVNK